MTAAAIRTISKKQKRRKKNSETNNSVCVFFSCVSLLSCPCSVFSLSPSRHSCSFLSWCRIYLKLLFELISVRIKCAEICLQLAGLFLSFIHFFFLSFSFVNSISLSHLVNFECVIVSLLRHFSARIYFQCVFEC